MLCSCSSLLFCDGYGGRNTAFVVLREKRQPPGETPHAGHSPTPTIETERDRGLSLACGAMGARASPQQEVELAKTELVSLLHKPTIGPRSSIYVQSLRLHAALLRNIIKCSPFSFKPPHNAIAILTALSINAKLKFHSFPKIRKYGRDCHISDHFQAVRGLERQAGQKSRNLQRTNFGATSRRNDRPSLNSSLVLLPCPNAFSATGVRGISSGFVSPIGTVHQVSVGVHRLHNNTYIDYIVVVFIIPCQLYQSLVVRLCVLVENMCLGDNVPLFVLTTQQVVSPRLWNQRAWCYDAAEVARIQPDGVRIG